MSTQKPSVRVVEILEKQYRKDGNYLDVAILQYLDEQWKEDHPTNDFDE